jgi:tetratricopeptide (TPR) repeat protein
MACWRWTDSTVKQKAERSLELLDRAGTAPAQAGILWALGIYYMILADREKCRAVAERQLALARLLSDEGMQAAAQNSLSGTLLDEGDFRQALAVTDSTLKLYDPIRHANHATMYGLHTRALARMFRALSLCHLGHLHLSFEEAELAEQEALQARHSASRVLALFYRALTCSLAENRVRTHELCSHGIEIAKQHGHGAQLGYFASLDAWSQSNLHAIRGAVSALEQSGQGLALSFYQSLWAEVEAEHDHPDRALEITRRSICRSRSTGNESYLAASLSNEAAYLLQLDSRAVESSESLLLEARALARSQCAMLQELKVVSRLARLLFASERVSEAIELLEEYRGPIDSEIGVPVVDRLRDLWKQYRSFD